MPPLLPTLLNLVESEVASLFILDRLEKLKVRFLKMAPILIWRLGSSMGMMELSLFREDHMCLPRKLNLNQPHLSSILWLQELPQSAYPLLDPEGHSALIPFLRNGRIRKENPNQTRKSLHRYII